MSLGNARIDQHPLGIPTNGDYLIYRDQINGITKKAIIDPFLSSGTTGNIEWVSDNDPGYAEDDIVTYSGDLYQSTINDNLNIPPSTDFTTNPANPLGKSWLKLTRGKTWQLWEAGVFVEDVVFVLYSFEGELHIVQLRSETRPYVSSDFLAEYEAGDWMSITQNITQKNGVVGSGFINFDMGLMKKRDFNVAGIAINNPKTWALVNDVFALGIDELHFTMGSTLSTQTFPADWFVGEATNAVWDNDNKYWTPLAEGNYTAELSRDYSLNIWKVIIHGPF